MSKYTTEVRYICENYAGRDESSGCADIETIINTAYPLIFSNEIPFLSETEKSRIEKMILRHFYTREIGFETVGLWKFKINTRLREIMPFYNKLYYSANIEYDPLKEIDYERTQDIDRDSNTTGNDLWHNHRDSEAHDKDRNVNSSKGENRHLYSDTPQGSLQNVDNETYLTNASKDLNNTVDTQLNATDAESKTDTTNNRVFQNIENGKDKLVEKIKGKMSGTSYSKLISEYRDTIINIDLMIVRDLEDLFLQLW